MILKVQFSNLSARHGFFSSVTGFGTSRFNNSRISFGLPSALSATKNFILHIGQDAAQGLCETLLGK